MSQDIQAMSHPLLFGLAFVSTKRLAAIVVDSTGVPFCVVGHQGGASASGCERAPRPTEVS